MLGMRAFLPLVLLSLSPGGVHGKIPRAPNREVPLDDVSTLYANITGPPEDLWVVLVGTSRNWLNYRDNSNTIALYRMFRHLGVPDRKILLMLGHSMACDPRNPHVGELFVNPDHAWELYSGPIEVDYRGAEVTVDNFLRVLSGFHFPGTPPSKQLQSTARSDVLIYLTGHGGDKFLKFQDKEELQADDLADALHHMYLQKRYRSILFISDTCQADSLHSQLRSPGILAIASSAKGENSYSYLPDQDLGVTVVDRFTFTTLRFLDTALRSFSSQAMSQRPPQHSLSSLFAAFDPKFLMSTPCIRSDLYPLPLEEVPALQYFASPEMYTTTAQEGTGDATGISSCSFASLFTVASQQCEHSAPTLQDTTHQFQSSNLARTLQGPPQDIPGTSKDIGAGVNCCQNVGNVCALANETQSDHFYRVSNKRKPATITVATLIWFGIVLVVSLTKYAVSAKAKNVFLRADP